MENMHSASKGSKEVTSYKLSEINSDQDIMSKFAFGHASSTVTYYQDKLRDRAIEKKPLGRTPVYINDERFEAYTAQAVKQLGKAFYYEGEFKTPFYQKGEIYIPCNIFNYQMQLPIACQDKSISWENVNLLLLDETEVHEHVHVEDHVKAYNEIILPWLVEMIKYLKENEKQIHNQQDLDMYLNKFYQEQGDIDSLLTSFIQRLKKDNYTFHNLEAGKEVGYNIETYELQRPSGSPEDLYKYVESNYSGSEKLMKMVGEARERKNEFDKFVQESYAKRRVFKKNNTQSKEAISNSQDGRSLIKLMMRLVSDAINNRDTKVQDDIHKLNELYNKMLSHGADDYLLKTYIKDILSSAELSSELKMRINEMLEENIFAPKSSKQLSSFAMISKETQMQEGNLSKSSKRESEPKTSIIDPNTSGQDNQAFFDIKKRRVEDKGDESDTEDDEKKKVNKSSEFRKG